ncbi:hypothetical protein MKW92_016036 [Papaver armeniacum]|nr:hypothetical protein MKW92_016036 [Papaver armeniacum]
MEVTLNTGLENFHSRKRKYGEDECCSEQGDLFPEETDYEQAEPVMDIIRIRKSHYLSSDGCSYDRDDLSCDDLFLEETGPEQEISKTEPKMDINSDIMWDIHLRKRNYLSSDECSIDRDDLSCDDLFPKETSHEHEVSRAEHEMLDIHFRKRNYMSSDECSCDRDDLSCDDPFLEDIVNKHEVLPGDQEATTTEHADIHFRKMNYMSSDDCSCDRDDLSCDDLFLEDIVQKHEVLLGDQEATTSLMGYDTSYSKTKRENRKEDASSEDKLLVDFIGPQSDKPLESPFFPLNPKDPLYERSAADAHQVGSHKQNGVQNTLLNEVNVTADEQFSSITSDVSFQTVPKDQLKVSFELENLPQIGQETHRLAILRLDLSQVRAADLFGRMRYFLPKGGQIKSVGVYSTEKHMKEDGPVGLFDDKVDERLVMSSLASEESRRRYYGVVECDSTDTAKFVYKDFTSVFSYIGVTPKMLELRFIPDLMKLDDHLHDIATEEPTTYGGPDLIHLLSAKDLEQIVIVPEHGNPKLQWDANAPRHPRRFHSKMFL